MTQNEIQELEFKTNYRITLDSGKTVLAYRCMDGESFINSEDCTTVYHRSQVLKAEKT